MCEAKLNGERAGVAPSLTRRLGEAVSGEVDEVPRARAARHHLEVVDRLRLACGGAMRCGGHFESCATEQGKGWTAAAKAINGREGSARDGLPTLQKQGERRRGVARRFSLPDSLRSSTRTGGLGHHRELLAVGDEVDDGALADVRPADERKLGELGRRALGERDAGLHVLRLGYPLVLRRLDHLREARLHYDVPDHQQLLHSPGRRHLEDSLLRRRRLARPPRAAFLPAAALLLVVAVALHRALIGS